MVEKCYEQKPDGIIESERYKIIWDMNQQCNQVIEARRADIVFINEEEKEINIIDVTFPGNIRIKEKELEKVDNISC